MSDDSLNALMLVNTTGHAHIKCGHKQAPRYASETQTREHNVHVPLDVPINFLISHSMSPQVRPAYLTQTQERDEKGHPNYHPSRPIDVSPLNYLGNTAYLGKGT